MMSHMANAACCDGAVPRLLFIILIISVSQINGLRQDGALDNIIHFAIHFVSGSYDVSRKPNSINTHCSLLFLKKYKN